MRRKPKRDLDMEQVARFIMAGAVEDPDVEPVVKLHGACQGALDAYGGRGTAAGDWRLHRAMAGLRVALDHSRSSRRAKGGGDPMSPPPG